MEGYASQAGWVQAEGYRRTSASRMPRVLAYACVSRSGGTNALDQAETSFTEPDAIPKHICIWWEAEIITRCEMTILF